jgi:hypothetical protein
MEDAHIASSIAHSKIVVLIVSEKTFGVIDVLDDKSSCEGPLASLLLQCELIVEIYGLRQERLKVLPICFGVEGVGSEGESVFGSRRRGPMSSKPTFRFREIYPGQGQDAAQR